MGMGVMPPTTPALAVVMLAGPVSGSSLSPTSTLFGMGDDGMQHLPAAGPHPWPSTAQHSGWPPAAAPVM